MLVSCLLSVLLTAPSIEIQVERALRDKFEQAGRRMPTRDTRLDTAAKTLSSVGLARGTSTAVGFLEVTQAMSDATAFDPSPVVILLKGRGQTLLDALDGQKIGHEAPATHLGIGFVRGEGDFDVLCIIITRRLFELAPFLRSFAKPGNVTLCGNPLNAVKSAEVFVTTPAGQVESQSLKRQTRGYCGVLSLSRFGRYSIEVLLKSDRGPEVAALFFADVGGKQFSRVESSQASAETNVNTPAEARVAILEAINGLRTRFQVAAVTRDAELEAVAQSFAEDLDREQFFAHVAPDGSSLKDRLKRARYNYAAAGENLGAAQTAMAAHFGIENSPGHRLNLLDPRFRKAGLGVVKNEAGRWIVVEVFADPEGERKESEADPRDALTDALNARRSSKQLPLLKRLPALDSLAQAHAVAAQQWGKAQVDIPNERPLPERVFELLDDAATASVDVFTSESTTAIPTTSSNLHDRSNRWVGIGVVKPSNQSYWFVIIYASPRR
jgi:uncharacterized protein YkwD